MGTGVHSLFWSTAFVCTAGFVLASNCRASLSCFGRARGMVQDDVVKSRNASQHAALAESRGGAYSPASARPVFVSGSAALECGGRALDAQAPSTTVCLRWFLRWVFTHQRS